MEPFVWKLELVLRQELHSNSGKTELSLTFYLPVDNTGVELPATVCVFFYEVLLITVVSGVLPKNILPSVNCWLAVLWKCTRTPWQTCCRPRLSRIICSTWETLLVWSKVLSSPPLTLLKILITSSDSGAMRYAIFNPKWYIVTKQREWFTCNDYDSRTCESWKTRENTVKQTKHGLTVLITLANDNSHRHQLNQSELKVKLYIVTKEQEWFND